MRNEGGFALLTVLLTLIGVTALAAAAFVLSYSDNRVSQNDTSSLEAFPAANAGLYEYLGTQEDTSATTAGTATVNAAAITDLRTDAVCNDRVLRGECTAVGVDPTTGGPLTQV